MDGIFGERGELPVIVVFLAYTFPLFPPSASHQEPVIREALPGEVTVVDDEACIE